MRKVKRFAAIVLTVALLSPTTAYAGNVEDAKALYEQVTEKQKSVTDMNAYYDYQIHLSGSALEGVEDLSNMRLEMNVRMNHLTDMGNLQYSSYSRATVPGQEPMISTMYYKDGTCYMETAGTKIKYPMDLTQMAEQISSQTMMLASGQAQEDLMTDFRLWTIHREKRFSPYRIYQQNMHRNCRIFLLILKKEKFSDSMVWSVPVVPNFWRPSSEFVQEQKEISYMTERY